jgi:nicotine blue oxidoreductase
VTVAGLLLAAGAGTRIGTPKALLELDGETLLARGVRLLRAAGLDPVVVVLGAAAEQARGLVAEAEVVVADDWATGQGASLRAGLRALGAAEGVVVTLVDEPGLSPEAVTRVLAAASEGDAAQATYDGRPGHPVYLHRRVWDEVAAAATGDEGARVWMRAHREQVVLVPCDGLGQGDDVDDLDDLARLSAPARPASP